jgi:hypothetical protein
VPESSEKTGGMTTNCCNSRNLLASCPTNHHQPELFEHFRSYSRATIKTIELKQISRSRARRAVTVYRCFSLIIPLFASSSLNYGLGNFSRPTRSLKLGCGSSVSQWESLVNTKSPLFQEIGLGDNTPKRWISKDVGRILARRPPNPKSVL